MMKTPRGYMGDTAPSVPMAGKPGETLRASVNPYDNKGGVRPSVQDLIQPAPRTPDNLSDLLLKHRQRAGPGEITMHWGLKDTRVPPPGRGYGVKSNQGESVAQNFKAGMKLGVAEYLESVGEAVYQSTRREPLGKTFNRGHHLPERTQGSQFQGFGIPSNKDEPAKEIVFPRDIEPETESVKAQYVRTHGSYDPGERVDRDYHFPSRVRDNPHFRFGVAEPSCASGAGVKSALTMDVGEEPHAVPPTKVVRHSLEKYRQVATDHLGKGRNPMQAPHESPDHTYGIKSGSDDIDAGFLIRGNYGLPDQMPDRDLGCCTVPGRRNFLSDRSFGVPTVRRDLDPGEMHKRSVACSTNFGDDPSAFNLIFPGKFQFQGVGDTDFRSRRPAEELMSVLNGAGYRTDPEDFEEVFAYACELHGDGQATVSLEAFMTAYTKFAAHTGRSWAKADAH